MTLGVRYQAEARQDMKAIKKRYQPIKPDVDGSIRALREEPFARELGPEPMSGPFKGCYRIHCQGKAHQWRIVYWVDNDELVIEVVQVKHRGDPRYGK